MPSMLNWTLSFQCGGISPRFNELTQIFRAVSIFTIKTVYLTCTGWFQESFVSLWNLKSCPWSILTKPCWFKQDSPGWKSKSKTQFTELWFQEIYLIADSSCFHCFPFKVLQNQIVFKQMLLPLGRDSVSHPRRNKEFCKNLLYLGFTKVKPKGSRWVSC
jgi:hypothetical protein